MQTLDPADILSVAFDPSRQNSAAAAEEEEDGRVEFFLFRDNNNNDNNTNFSSTNGPVSNVVDEVFCKECLGVVSPIVQSHLWHRGRFDLMPVTLNDLGPALWGSFVFGDCSDDEWLCVYLIRLLTLRFPDLIARVVDQDGEFLVMEASMALNESLLDMDLDNRVFVKQGKLLICDKHLVLDESDSETDAQQDSTDPDELTPSQILDAARSPDALKTYAVSDEAQHLAWRRVAGFPDKLIDATHYARCLLPAAAAFWIDKYPSLVSHAVRGFINRSDESLQVISRLKRKNNRTSDTNTTTNSTQTTSEHQLLFLDSSNKNNNNSNNSNGSAVIDVIIPFSRMSFAMISFQTWHAPESLETNVSPTDPTMCKAYELGQRLAVGLELAFHDDAGFLDVVRASHVAMELRKTDVDTEKMSMKKVAMRLPWCYVSDELPSVESIVKHNNECWSEMATSVEQIYLKYERSVDSEEWLNKSMEGFDDELEGQYGQGENPENTNSASSDAPKDLNAVSGMISALKSFVGDGGDDDMINVDSTGDIGDDVNMDLDADLFMRILSGELSEADMLGLGAASSEDVAAENEDEGSDWRPWENETYRDVDQNSGSSDSEDIDEEDDSNEDDDDSNDDVSNDDDSSDDEDEEEEGDENMVSMSDDDDGKQKQQENSHIGVGENDNDDDLKPTMSEENGVNVNSEQEATHAQVMAAMDAELQASLLASSFERMGYEEDVADGGFEDVDTDATDFGPVDVDVNLVKNILASLDAQEGGAGPGGNLLGELGIHITPSTNSTD